MSVKVEKLMEIVEELGLSAEPMSAYYKVACGDKAVYITRTQKVSRVDLSGFTIKHPAVKELSEEDARALKLGRVRAQLDFSKSEERVLEAFRSSLAMMKHMAGDEEIPTLGAGAAAWEVVHQAPPVAETTEQLEAETPSASRRSTKKKQQSRGGKKRPEREHHRER